MLPKYRDVAMVFQSYALYPHKTVAENIGFPLKVRGVAAGGARARWCARPPRRSTWTTCSSATRASSRAASASGSRWRARSCGGPSVFLMDEPLSNLDAKLRGYMRAELKHMQHELGVTTVYVTHDQVEAMTLAHRVAVMDQGVLQQIGTPREVYDQPANLFVAGFMGSPPMNFVAGEIASGRFESQGVSLPVTGPMAPAPAVMGFRPEDAEMVEPGAGLFDATVFAAELTGDVTLVTLSLGAASLAVKMPKEFDVDFDRRVAVRFPLGPRLSVRRHVRRAPAGPLRPVGFLLSPSLPSKAGAQAGASMRRWRAWTGRRRRTGEQPAVGLLLEGLQRALEADHLTRAEAPGRDQQEAADDQEHDAAGDQPEAADRRGLGEELAVHLEVFLELCLIALDDVGEAGADHCRPDQGDQPAPERRLQELGVQSCVPSSPPHRRPSRRSG